MIKKSCVLKKNRQWKKGGARGRKQMLRNLEKQMRGLTRHCESETGTSTCAYAVRQDLKGRLTDTIQKIYRCTILYRLKRIIQSVWMCEAGIITRETQRELALKSMHDAGEDADAPLVY